MLLVPVSGAGALQLPEPGATTGIGVNRDVWSESDMLPGIRLAQWTSGGVSSWSSKSLFGATPCPGVSQPGGSSATFAVDTYTVPSTVDAIAGVIESDVWSMKVPDNNDYYSGADVGWGIHFTDPGAALTMGSRTLDESVTISGGVWSAASGVTVTGTPAWRVGGITYRGRIGHFFYARRKAASGRYWQVTHVVRLQETGGARIWLAEKSWTGEVDAGGASFALSFRQSYPNAWSLSDNAPAWHLPTYPSVQPPVNEMCSARGNVLVRSALVTDTVQIDAMWQAYEALDVNEWAVSMDASASSGTPALDGSREDTGLAGYAVGDADDKFVSPISEAFNPLMDYLWPVSRCADQFVPIDDGH